MQSKMEGILGSNAQIFYSLHSEDAGYPGKGLFRANLDGNESSLILDAEMVEGLSIVGDYLLFYSADDNYLPTLRRLEISTGDII